MMKPGPTLSRIDCSTLDRESHAGGELASVLVRCGGSRGESRTGRRGAGAAPSLHIRRTLPASAGTRRRRRPDDLGDRLPSSSCGVSRWFGSRTGDRTEERTEFVAFAVTPSALVGHLGDAGDPVLVRGSGEGR